jgi:type IV secretion system protein VirB10
LTVQAGTVIPGFLITGINSELPGQILGQVARDVYDSPTQRILLIPKGSKLLATYDDEIIAGQNRVLVAFTRLIFPDGRSLALPGLGITDTHGASGVRDHVDNHYRRIFGTAVLLSVLSAGAQLSQPRQATSLYASPSVGQTMAGAVGEELTDVAAQLIRKNLDIQPTLSIRPGTAFNVFLNTDISFREPFTDQRSAR